MTVPDDGVAFDDVIVKVETQPREPNMGALLVVIDGDEVWVPKSVIHDDSEVYQGGDTGTLMVKSWWAAKNGLA
jgi:hypothetical protein